MKKIAVLLLVSAFFLTGCTGSFILTKKVYDFHRSQQDKWMDEVIFLGCVIIPVYGLATLGDAIIFNSIEFWTKENPLEKSASAKERKLVEQGDLSVVLTYSKSDDTVKVTSMKSLSKDKEFVLERTASGVVAKDTRGTVLFSSVSDAQGGISIYDSEKNLVKYFSAEEVEAAKKS